MKKQNCWEYMKCGREIGGAHALDLGLCPAVVEISLDGVHGGEFGGRACWALAGTLCNWDIQGTFAQKYKDCTQCDFYKYVEKQEGDDLLPPVLLLKRIEDYIDREL